MNFKNLIILIILVFFAISCNSQKEKTLKHNSKMQHFKYFANENLSIKNNIALIEILYTLENIDPAIFDVYSEYLIKSLSIELREVKEFNIYYDCDKVNKNILYKYSGQDINLIKSYSFSRNEVIKDLLIKFNYKELSEMEMGYYQFEKYSDEYKKIEHTFLELAIRKASECYLDEKKVSNFNFVINMFNETNHNSYVERINQIIDKYCFD